MAYIKQVTTKDFAAIEEQIRNAHQRPEDTYTTWKKLHDDFKELTPADDRKYWWTYFRLYTELTWKLSSQLEREDFINIAIGRQLPMALLLDFDVWKTMMWYLSSRGADDKDMGLLFSEMKAAFEESPAYVGVWKGKDVTLKELVVDLQVSKRPGKSSMEAAETMAKIKGSFFAKENPEAAELVIAEPDVLLGQFVGLYDFFAEYEPDRIWNVVQSYVNPSFIDSFSTFIEEKNKALEALDTGVLPVSSQPTPTPVSKPAATVEKTAASNSQKPTYMEIRMVAERKFEKDAMGDFNNPEDVMDMLDQWATQYGDDKIRELFIFNEQTGSFEWNNQLLTQ